MTTITLAIPDTEVLHDPPRLIEYLHHHLDSLRDALDLDVSQEDEKSRVESIRVMAVQVTPESIAIDYEFSFSAHYGCRDLDFCGHARRTAHGVKQGDRWSFATPERWAERSTTDEF